jgi:PAS domain S-box-containing protein
MEWHNSNTKEPEHDQKVLLSANGIYTVCNYDTIRKLYLLSSNKTLTYQKGYNTYWTEFADEHGEFESKQLQKDNFDLQYKQSFLTQLIDCSHEVILALDTELNFLMVNKKYEEIMKLRREEVIGKSLLEVNPKVVDTIQHEYLKRAIKGETLTLGRRPGVAREDLVFETHFNPLVIDGKIRGVVVLSREVLFMKDAEK